MLALNVLEEEGVGPFHAESSRDVYGGASPLPGGCE
jgi:hypothetical protein